MLRARHGSIDTRATSKVWSETVEAHRREVRDAILETTARLVAEHGFLSVTMSRIAEEVGIGRATLYKHFAGVEAILAAWHERKVADHFQQLAAIRHRSGDAGERLAAVLEAYALMTSDRPHDTELAAIVHRSEHFTQAHHQFHAFIRDLLAEAAKSGAVRDDIAPDELANYCLHALAAAGSLPSRAAVQRLVAVTLAGLRPND